MPTLGSVTNFFAKPFENTVSMSLGGTIASGATTVPVNGMSNYSNGDVVVFVVDPNTPASKQVFTGTVSGTNVVNVVWTEGTNQTHTTGTTVIDYVSATTVGMIVAGLLKQHTQAGAHTGLTTDTLSTSGNAAVGGTLGVTGATTLTGAVGGAGYDSKTIANSIKFLAYRSAPTTLPGSGYFVFDATQYNTGSGYNTTTGIFTAPSAGFYKFDSKIAISPPSGGAGEGFNLMVNGAAYLSSHVWVPTYGGAYEESVIGSFPPIHLAIGDTVGINTAAYVTSLAVGGGTAPMSTYFGGYIVSAT